VSVELDVNHPDGGARRSRRESAEDDERFRLALLRLHEGDRRAIVARIDLGYSYDQTASCSGRRRRRAGGRQKALLRLAAKCVTMQASRLPPAVADAIADGWT
jgi:DNA-directed RNA polymerase specialized sigma24 family protein